MLCMCWICYNKYNLNEVRKSRMDVGEKENGGTISYNFRTTLNFYIFFFNKNDSLN